MKQIIYNYRETENCSDCIFWLNNRFNQYIFGTKTSFSISQPTILGDVDGDDEVNAYDVTFIQRYLAGFETPYPIGEKVVKQ